MKKFVSIKGVIDNIRLSVNTPPTPSGTMSSGSPGPVRLEKEIIESLTPEQFTLQPTLRHGFPFKPLSMAYDSVQKLMAIGNRSGVVKIYGKPGIDSEIFHENGPGVLQILFLVNSGKLLTTTTDDRLNLWDFKKKTPELLQSIRLQKESISTVFSDFQESI
ncbi:STXBP5 [Lepeophtheirus salmonis]|uniref:STXBP5 n=2 Tax=Lepeophtheirus salmonis TaxID=72036 RepID=A0A7R8D729_LEPSM|nr:STXBP5 [Lepeophtheirus salmonis]CAF3022324.1 STXBP5 [Lepeophtheirus salmonis]